MAPFSTKKCQESSQDSPGFDNLEIRCTWNGVFFCPVNIRISLEVRCTPNTELQLLNTRPANISLIHTFLDRLPLSECSSENSKTGQSPQSPLFAFSSLTSDDHTSKRSSLSSPAHTSKGECETATDLTSEVQDCAITSYQESTHSSSQPQDRAFSSRGSQSSVSSAKTRPKVIERDGLIESQKNSTLDTYLLEVEDRTSGTKGVPKKSTSDPHSIIPVKQMSLGGDCLKSTKLVQLASPQRSHEHKPSLIPKLTSRLEKPLVEDTPSNSIDEQLLNNHGSEPDTGKAPIGSVSSSSPSEDLDSQISLLDQNGPPKADITWSDSEINLSGEEQTSKNSLSLSSTTMLEGDIALHHLESPKAAGRELPSEPQVELVDGILVVKNSANVQSTTYKIAITASILLLDGRMKNWYDLIIPGLPSMGRGKSGFFLFLIPEDQGLEFRTTNFHRNKIVENCFVAEFANGCDLVVPLRKCDRMFYGVLRDFTVDQEVLCGPITPLAENSSESDQSRFMVNYHAMCSLKLHNRCFWAEKCCFVIYLDGGPEGAFQYDLDSQESRTDIQKINLTADIDAPIGISRLQVICSPKEMEAFCITWKVGVPAKRALCWLPRIYSTSSLFRELNRDQLRLLLTEMYGSPLKSLPDGSIRTSEAQRSDGGTASLSSEGGQLQEEQDLSPPRQFLITSLCSLIILKISQRVQETREFNASYTQDNRTWRRTAVIGLFFFIFLFPGIPSLLTVSRIYRNPSIISSEDTPYRVTDGTLCQVNPGIWGRFSRKFFGDQRGSADNFDTFNKNICLSIKTEMQTPIGDIKISQNNLIEDTIGGSDESGRKQDAEIDRVSMLGTSASQLSLRDKIDYLLGWRGPPMDTAE